MNPSRHPNPGPSRPNREARRFSPPLCIARQGARVSSRTSLRHRLHRSPAGTIELPPAARSSAIGRRPLVRDASLKCRASAPTRPDPTPSPLPLFHPAACLSRYPAARQSVLVRQLERELASTVSALRDERSQRHGRTEALRADLEEARSALRQKEAELDRCAVAPGPAR